jgi:hypothetical protein
MQREDTAPAHRGFHPGISKKNGHLYAADGAPREEFPCCCPSAAHTSEASPQTDESCYHSTEQSNTSASGMHEHAYPFAAT